MINLNEKIYQWVEDKVGDKIDSEIEESLLYRNKIDVTSYAQKLVEEVFSDAELQNLRAKLLAEREFESDFLVGDEEILDGDVLDLSTLSLQDVKAGTAEESLKHLLLSLEYLAPDEVICQADWPTTRAVLQDLLLHCQSVHTAVVILKVFKRLVTYSNSPKTVCEGFLTLAESVTSQVEEINNRVNTVEAEELFDIKDNKAYRRSSQSRRVEKVESVRLEVVTRSMCLLVSAHDSMPGIWLRFNEKRLHEIIFSFTHMLAVSFSVERRNLSAFDLVTALQPRGNWCRHWCHTALGRTLLSQALRRNRRFLNALVDTVIQGILTALNKRTRRTSSSDSSPTTPTSQEPPLLGLPEKPLKSARFCHCFSMLTYIIQYRVGRTLFPLQTPSRRRPWTVQDVVGLMVDYLTFLRQKHDEFSPFYVHHIMALGRSLLETESEILTARGTQPMHSRRSLQ